MEYARELLFRIRESATRRSFLRAVFAKARAPFGILTGQRLSMEALPKATDLENL